MIDCMSRLSGQQEEGIILKCYYPIDKIDSVVLIRAGYSFEKLIELYAFEFILKFGNKFCAFTGKLTDSQNVTPLTRIQGWNRVRGITRLNNTHRRKRGHKISFNSKLFEHMHNKQS